MASVNEKESVVRITEVAKVCKAATACICPLNYTKVRQPFQHLDQEEKLPFKDIPLICSTYLSSSA
jgi:hypothetical protein